MPVFRFTQQQTKTHEIVVRADSLEEAEEYVMALDEDEFPHTDETWDDEPNGELVDENEVTVDVDVAEEFG